MRIENCLSCDRPRPVRTYAIAPHETPRPYLRCTHCKLVFEEPQLRGASFDFSKAVEELTAEDEEAFRDQFVESLSVGDENGLYPEFEYSDAAEMPDGLFDELNRTLSRRFAPDDAFRLLEVGCASGFLLRRLLEVYPNATVVGIEPSPVACRAGQEAGLDIRNGTTETVPLPDESFDVAVCIGSLMIHENPRQTLAAMSDVLKPGGVLVVDAKNVQCTVRQVGRFVGRLPGSSAIPQLRRLAAQSFEAMRFAFDCRSLEGMLSSTGFEVESVETKPPRRLAFSNRSSDTRGLSGLLWRTLDRIDQMRGQRAWIDVVAVKREDAVATSRLAA